MDLFEILEKFGQKYKHFICKIYIFGVCVLIFGSLHCETVMLSVCSLRLLVQKKVSVEDLDDKNSVGLLCQPVWRGAHAAPLPLLLCARLSHFVQRKRRGRRGAIGEEHKAWQSHSHRRLNHNSIIVENVFLRLLCSGSERGLLMSCESWAQKTPLFRSVTEVWIVSVWQFELLPSYAATERNASTL